MAGTFEESAIMSGLKKKSEIAETTSTGTSAGSAGVGGGAIVGGPTTYEQEYAMFKRKGARRITAMTYESELDETLDSKPYDYQQTFSSSNEHMYEFITNDGHEYVTLIDGGPNWVHVSFSVTNEYGNPDLKIQSQKGSPVEDPRRIFATVIAIVKDFTANMKPPHIYFSAAESSRIRLYDAFVRRLDREMPEYELVPEENTKPKKTKMYVLRRKPTV
jgi:hypothetical protein